MVLINNNDEFLSKVGKLYESTKSKKSVWVTFKKYAPPEKKSDKEKKIKVPDNSLLVRATNGDEKYSTIVSHKDLVRFQVSFAVLSKDKMSGLKRGKELMESNLSTSTKKKKKTENPDSGSNSPSTKNIKVNDTISTSKSNKKNKK
eukprot:gene6640-10805_t